MKRAASCVTVAAALFWAAGTGRIVGDEQFDRRLMSFAEAATSARRTRDFAAVERIRSERLTMLSAAGDSPWGAAIAALAEADKRLDRLDYRGACETLRAAWRPFSAPEASAGPAGVPGDVAMKLFEAAQAAVALHPRCLEQDNPERVATRDELRRMLQTAIDRDPCAVEARAALAFLTRPTPKEAFFRVEQRPSVQARNRLIAEIDYEGTGPVMPWHAPVAWLKAGNFSFVLDDLDFSRSVLDRGPNNRIRGLDARNAPFDVLANSHLLVQFADDSGRDNPAVLFLASRGVKTEWRRLDLHLVEISDTRVPAAGTRAGESERRPSAGRGASDHRLGPFRLRIIRQPSGLTADALETLPVLALDSLKRFEASIADGEKSLAKNPAAAPAVLLPADAVLSGSPDVVRPRQPSGRTFLVPLDLDSIARKGAMVVGTQASKPVAQPPFIRPRGEATGGEVLPFLQGSDGSRLEIDADRRAMSIRFPRGKVVLPLDATVIPPAIAVATDDGRSFEEVLVAAGYTEADASKEMLKVLAEPTSMPAKLVGKSIAPQTRDRVQRLRSLLAGLRYLETERGNLIVTRGSLSTAAGPVAGDERLLRVFSSGGERFDRETTFSVADAQSAYASIVGEFLPKAIRLAPSLSLWRGFDEEVARRPPAAVASGWTAHAAIDAALENPWKTGPAPSAVPPAVSEAPSPPEPADIALSIEPAFWNLHRRAHRPQRFTMRSLERDAVSGTVVAVDIPCLSLRLPPAEAWAVGQPPAAGGVPTARETLLSLGYRQAGADAVAGRYHRAIVGYHDVLGELRSVSLPRAIVAGEADASTPARFDEHLGSFVRLTRTEVIFRLELAAVLRAAGRSEAASFVESMLRDRLEMVVFPMIDSAIDRARAWGYREPSDVKEFARSIAALFAAADDATVGPHVREAFAKADGGVSIGDWLVQKKLDASPAVGGFPPAVTCPIDRLVVEEDAPEPMAAIVSDTDVDAFSAWGGLDRSAAQADPRAAGYLFLLGWYWLEQGRPSHAAMAFSGAARSFSERAGDRTSPEGAVARRNALMMLVAATSCDEPPPGATSEAGRSLDEIGLLSAAWERETIAAGISQKAARAESGRLDLAIGLARDAAAGRAAAATDRYSFFDSRYRHGAIPDVAVDAAAETVTASWDAWKRENQAAVRKAKEQDPPGPPPPPKAPPPWPDWPVFLAERFRMPSEPDPRVVGLGR